jgi:hypothetical protein
MSNTLPPGWTGNSKCHQTEIVGLRLIVTEFPYSTRFWWRSIIGNVVQDGPERGHETAAEARADGLAAVEAFARKLLEETAKLREAPNE